jgi:hypothetical protein
MELLKQQTLMYQQQNAIKWGNSVWSDGLAASPASRSLREIQEEEQKRKEIELRKKEVEEAKRKEEADKRREEEGIELLWAQQGQGGGKLSLREIQEQERKRDKLIKEREAATKVCKKSQLPPPFFFFF